HIDHGKTTLTDRFLEIAGLLSGEHPEQFLDSMELERERGITIKAKVVSFEYKGYLFNLVDTPGHVDFSYEVSRVLTSCEGSILLVDATQGVEAQTVANCELAMKEDLEIIPVINKIDLPNAQIEKTKNEIMEILPVNEDEIYLVSAKTGYGVRELLDDLIEKIPPPSGEKDLPLRALIFDSVYDSYKGAIVYIKVFEGEIKRGMKIKFYSSGDVYEVNECGVQRIQMIKTDELVAGEIGYVVAGIKDISDVKIGDTIVEANDVESKPLPGFKEVKPFVFSSFFPVEETTIENLKNAIEKLHLNDASFEARPINSPTLGFGYRCGFLGTLHMEIIRERLEREFSLKIITTSPNVVYKVKLRNGDTISVDNPSNFPDPAKIEEIYEPITKITVVSPVEYISGIMELLKEKRGKFLKMHYINPTRVIIEFMLPLSEMIQGLYSQIKAISKGFASFDYEHAGYEKAELVKLDILINGKEVEGLSIIVPKEKAYRKGRELVERLSKIIPRQLFEVAIQAAIGKRVIARATVKALRKDVLAKCYGGDVTRKRKLLEKQKEGKKRMKRIGKVDVPQEAFWEVWK
ncbi:MAG: elongation factor 4, partial [Caldiserica bacterium]